jgi:hypothetical protein
VCVFCFHDVIWPNTKSSNNENSPLFRHWLVVFFSFFSSLLFLLIFIPIIPNDFRPYRVPSPLLLFLLAYPAAFFLQSPLLITQMLGVSLDWTQQTKAMRRRANSLTPYYGRCGWLRVLPPTPNPTTPLTRQGGRIPYNVNIAKTINTTTPTTSSSIPIQRERYTT